MKILELRFKNLNSLYGEWIIDFTDPEYGSNGIFVLTGPTGAGKSTILDAICLALYGATPRLGKITKSSNEIMSRQKGDCYAEVLFESRAGQFRCHWEQRRARKKAEGRLQDQEHQIIDEHTGKPIETKKSLVGAVIEEKTGMDFHRFTRSILLAQGGFDSFLNAEVEEKSKILEQITGTEIYSEISRRVHERYRSEEEKLNLLKAEVMGIPLIEPEEEQEIQKALGSKQKQEAALAGVLTQTGKAITWQTAIEGLKREILSLEDDMAELKAGTEAFRPQRDRLEKALEAASLEGIFATLTALRKQQITDETSLKAEEALLPELEKAAKRQENSLRVAEQNTLEVREEAKTALPLIQKIRFLDQKIAQDTRAISEGIEACTREAAEIERNRQFRAGEVEKWNGAEKMLEGVEEYLKENARDEWLISGLAGIQEQWANLLAVEQKILQKEVSFKQARKAVSISVKKLEVLSTDCLLKTRDLEAAGKNLQQARDTLNELLGGKLLREYRTEKDTLLREAAFLMKIEELESLRDRLEEGKTCPLCGSKEHPFATGHVPPVNAMERQIDALTKLIDKADELEGTIKKLEQAEAASRSHLNKREILKTDAAHEKKAAEKKEAELQDALGELRRDFEEGKKAMAQRLKSLGYTLDFSDPASVIRLLKSKIEKWQEQVSQKSRIEKQIAHSNSEVKGLDAVIETRVKALAEKQENLESLKKEMARTDKERKDLYGSKKPDEEEQRLNICIAHAGEAEKKARDLYIQLQQKLATGKSRVQALKQGLEKRMPELKKRETGFSKALISAGFADEKSFLHARMALEEREALSSRARELDKAGIELRARHKDRTTRLTAEIAKNLSHKSLEELKGEFKDTENALEQLRDAIAGFKHKLNENHMAKERIKEKQAAMEARKKECSRFGKLHALIGSADGKKYRNFAQGLTFELMVAHANRQLEKMTDRYLLIRDEQQPLELKVLDNYQAGEIRSTRNLSGGESFIVSLTLALGLSNMASRKVRVDSLFLDEGFGTLDEETLETALESLSGLHQEGKLIGIISHVSALKERISTQINISPVSGGRSLISGPGCRRSGKSDPTF